MTVLSRIVMQIKYKTLTHKNHFGWEIELYSLNLDLIFLLILLYMQCIKRHQSFLQEFSTTLLSCICCWKLCRSSVQNQDWIVTHAESTVSSPQSLFCSHNWSYITTWTAYIKTIWLCFIVSMYHKLFIFIRKIRFIQDNCKTIPN